MKQSEKLDLILKQLYEFKYNGMYYSITSILYSYKIKTNFDEVFALAKKLERDGLIKIIGQHMDVVASLTTEGIMYVEGDSYSYNGSAIINNNYSISIVNSPNSNLISRSTNVTINQNINDVNDAIEKITKTIKEDKTIVDERLKEILECLSEIQEGIKKGIKPKFAIKSLLDITGGITSIAHFLIVLGQYAGLIPLP